MPFDTISDLIWSMYPKRAKNLVNHKKKRIRKKYSFLKDLDKAIEKSDKDEMRRG